MEEVFKGGTLDMSASPIPGLEALPAWGDLLTNRILAVVAVLVLLAGLPDLFRLVPHLLYGFDRSRGAAALEHSLGMARTRNLIALACVLPFCLMADRYGGARSILIGGALFAVGCLGAPFAGNVWLMYVLRAVTGLGASLVYINMIQVISKYCKENFTVVFGFMMCFGYAGSIAAGSPFVASVHSLGWKTALAVIGVVILIIWALYAGVYATIPKEPINPTPFNVMPIINVYRRSQNVRFSLFHCFQWGLYYTFLTVIGKKFLEDYCQMSALTASGIIMTMAALAAGFNFLSGILSRLVGNRRKPFIVGSAVLTILSNVLILLALCVGCRHWALVIPLYVITIMSNMSPVVVAWTKEVNPPDQGGVSLATMNFAAYFCVALVSREPPSYQP